MDPNQPQQHQPQAQNPQAARPQGQFPQQQQQQGAPPQQSYPQPGGPAPQQAQQNPQQNPRQQQRQQQPQQPQKQQQPAQIQSNPNSTQNTLEVAEIRDGLVIMSDGSYRAVIMAQSINFDLMSPEERESVEFSYQGFLNSLYFPIQILIRSQKVDLRPYIQKLEKLHNEQDNMLLAYLMEDYISYIQLLGRETNIMDKQFYIIIPYSTEVSAQQAVQASKGLLGKMFGPNKGVVNINENDLESAKTQLKNRVQSALGALIQMGVQGVPLDTQELIELFYDVYNPDTSTSQRTLSKTDFNAPIVGKGTGDASQPHLDREQL